LENTINNDSLNEIRLLEEISRFVNVPPNIMRLTKVLELDLLCIKDLKEDNAKKLKKILNVQTIGELADKKISISEVIVLKALGIPPYQLSGWDFISKLLNSAKIEEFLGPKKMSFFGLDNAGKTAIIKTLQQNPHLKEIMNLSPTKGINRINFNEFNTNYLIYDMGGQEKYRLEYIKGAERYFINNSIIIFVIDIQTPQLYETALLYLKDIFDINKSLKENPEYLFIIHKVDPNLKYNPEIRKNIKTLKKQLLDLIKDEKITYEIITYSIFNMLGEESNYLEEIPEFLVSSEGGEKQKIKILSDSLEEVTKTMNNVIKSIEKRFHTIEKSINNIQEWVQYVSLRLPDNIIPKKIELEPEKDEKTSILNLRKNIKDLLNISPKDND